MDGKLSFGEFLGEESHIQKIFKTMDKNNDGYVSKQVIYTHMNMKYVRARLTLIINLLLSSRARLIILNGY